MDIQVANVIPSGQSKIEERLILTAPGTRYGRLIIEKRNALGNVVLRCECGETIRLSPEQTAGGKYHQCESCDKWARKPSLAKFFGDEIYSSALSRGSNARDRCGNPNNKSYHRYGGRGIGFDFASVEDYVAHVGVIAVCGDFSGHVDRIDNDGDYAPGNLRIVSPQDNSRNRQVTTMVDGIPLAEISEANGLHPLKDSSKYKMLTSRIKYRRSTGDVGISEVLDMIEEIKSHVSNPNLVRKSKFRKLSVDGLPLAKHIEKIGYGNNRAVYDAAKATFSGGREPTAHEVNEYVHRFARKRGISPTVH